ncbi:MAG: SDR family NAD(P)-dependent oxidoreductase [Flavobacteriaceae bacterium]|nr:SDR family NAD(P)-dependent oxidoreductase [Flavobacteriaceae bacterium]
MKRICLITGATSGIGEALAYQLSSLDYKLILCGRKQSKLDKLQSDLSSQTEIITLNFDVRDREDVLEAIHTLPDEWKKIKVLINNAGNAHGLAHFSEAEIDDLNAMIDINVKGLMYVSKAAIPLMIQNAPGHIINISSIAGKNTYKNGVIYCASKKAVEAISEGLRLELLDKEIKVSNIAPGLVETNFSMVRFKGDETRSKAVYEGYTPLSANDISDLIVYILQAPTHVNIADVTILPTSQASSTDLIKRKSF